MNFIYVIKCKHTGDEYVGSTKQSLSKRLAQHRTDYKKYENNETGFKPVFLIISKGNYNIDLLEKVMDDDVDKTIKYYTDKYNLDSCKQSINHLSSWYSVDKYNSERFITSSEINNMEKEFIKKLLHHTGHLSKKERMEIQKRNEEREQEMKRKEDEIKLILQERNNILQQRIDILERTNQRRGERIQELSQLIRNQPAPIELNIQQ